ncbi:hypothetical protein VTH82DRAFT_1254 [Thermothelomyces myriococcoides]
MARLTSARDSLLVYRTRTDDCSGWDCLGDAAQFGIVLVIVIFTLTMVYLYWRLKIKANRTNRGDPEAADSLRVVVNNRSVKLGLSTPAFDFTTETQSLHNNTGKNYRPRESLSPSDLGYSSSSINTSVEAVIDNHRSFERGFRDQNGTITSESGATTLSDLRRRWTPSRPGPRQRPEPSRRRSPTTPQLRQSRGTSRGDRGRRRGVHARQSRKQYARLPGRVMGALGQMRRILRGEDWP